MKTNWYLHADTIFKPSHDAPSSLPNSQNDSLTISIFHSTDTVHALFFDTLHIFGCQPTGAIR